VITPGKRSRPPEPEPGVIEHRPEPLKVQLEYLRNELAKHSDQPTPDLYRALQDLINWAMWRIDRLLTRDQIQYQRWHVVSTFVRRYIAQHGTTRGSRKNAYHAAAKVLTGPYAGSPRTMKEDFLFGERAPGGTDPRSVRYRERFERRAREADKKRAQRRRGR
jgi:hypothetical protein